MSDIKAMSNLLGKYPPRMHMLKKWVLTFIITPIIKILDSDWLKTIALFV